MGDAREIEGIALADRLQLRLDLMPDATYVVGPEIVATAIEWLRNNDELREAALRVVADRARWRDEALRIQVRLFPRWWWFLACGVALGAAGERTLYLALTAAVRLVEPWAAPIMGGVAP